LIKLPELLEKDAPPKIGAIYKEIMASCRAPMVALVYRHLATQGSALTWAWGALAPIMRSGDLPSAAREIVSVASFPVVQNINDKNLIEFDLLDTDINAIRYIISGYHAANPCNIISTLILLKILALTEGKGEAAPMPKSSNLFSEATRLPKLPPMVDPERLPQVLLKLRPQTATSVGLVPSLYRHLGHWPIWLEDVAENSLIPLYKSGQIAYHSNKLILLAEEKAKEFIPIVRKSDSCFGRPNTIGRPSLYKTLEAFVETIPTLIIIGQILRQSLSKE